MTVKGVIIRIIIFLFVLAATKWISYEGIASMALLIALFAYLNMWEDRKNSAKIIKELTDIVREAVNSSSDIQKKTANIVKNSLESNEKIINDNEKLIEIVNKLIKNKPN